MEALKFVVLILTFIMLESCGLRSNEKSIRNNIENQSFFLKYEYSSFDSFNKKTRTSNNGSMIYFRDEKSINCLKFEALIDSNIKLQNLILDNFEVVTLDCSTENFKPKDEKSKFNSEFQTKTFNVNSVPLMVFLNRNGETLGKFGYSLEIKILEKMILEYSNNM